MLNGAAMGAGNDNSYPRPEGIHGVEIGFDKQLCKLDLMDVDL